MFLLKKTENLICYIFFVYDLIFFSLYQQFIFIKLIILSNSLILCNKNNNMYDHTNYANEGGGGLIGILLNVNSRD